ncbi:DUF5067 domain-containing protein [Lactiplantibacillus plantarum]|uniref:DUF5067 domain-containing protein n=1 Tax=Lactiplantibacillus plantarum TaxID=1590 RepID=UPI001F392713|nr:DUF5067 domain-containing protein [Lactiplantibacillus plantarum]UJM23520.1 DUF5067 domain-containing protein [Lactiplantibacillus plantarum]WRM27339.1 DUF5067 domain-containing protein [Lactiplantibacillus plantarum]
MKKYSVLLLAGMTALSLTACGNNNSSKTNSVNSSKAEKVSSTKSTDPSNEKWTFKDNVFSAGIETYKFTKSEIRDGSEDGTKILVLYCDVTNNSKKEQDPSNIYTVVNAYQKTDTANKQLLPGTPKYDDNGNNPIQKYEDGLNDKLLPGKTTQAAVMFKLENKNDVTVKFNNANFQTIGTKTYSVN